MKPILLTKAEGTGNDFVLVDNREGMLNEIIKSGDLSGFAKRILDRNLGVGGDGLIILGVEQNYPFGMRYFNRDGSEADLCLNGCRCLVSYAFRLGLLEDKGKFMTAAGPIGFFYKDGVVSIEVMPPVDIKLNFALTVNRKKLKAHFLKIGVPHCVIFVESYDDLDVVELGRDIREHKSFKPEGTNVNFVKQEGKSIFVRTYERGIEAETLSCGSGVLASAYIATKLMYVQSPVSCKTRGGELLVTIKDKLYIEGPTHFVFDGLYYV